MSLAPILAAPPLVQTHLAAALVALTLTPVIALMRKGTAVHRKVGWLWVSAMAVAALSSFGIRSSLMTSYFSPIHALSVLTLFSLTMAILARRQGNIAKHRGYMLGAAIGLVVAGAFTLDPGRIMGRVIFGG